MKFFKVLLFTLIWFVLIFQIVCSYLKEDTANENYEPFYDAEGVLYHDLEPNCLSGVELFHYEDENYTSLLGADLSVYQRNVDFEILKEAGVDFVYLRLGYRGYESGLLFKDIAFENLYAKARDVGLKTGVYFFTSARDSMEVKEEVDFILKYLQNKEIDLPIAYDLEEIEDEASRVNDITDETIMNNIHTFFSEIEKNGYDGILYTNAAYIKNHLNQKEISVYPLWLAQYIAFPDYEYPFEIWQYTNNGEIEGISQSLDLNLMIIKKQ